MTEEEINQKISDLKVEISRLEKQKHELRTKRYIDLTFVSSPVDVHIAAVLKLSKGMRLPYISFSAGVSSTGFAPIVTIQECG